MIVICRALAMLVWALLGLMVCDWGLRAIRNKERVIQAFEGTPQARFVYKFRLIWMALTLFAGTSMIVAAIVVWINPWAAVVLGGWPLLLSILIRKRNGVSFGCRIR